MRSYKLCMIHREYFSTVPFQLMSRGYSGDILVMPKCCPGVKNLANWTSRLPHCKQVEAPACDRTRSLDENHAVPEFKRFGRSTCRKVLKKGRCSTYRPFFTLTKGQLGLEEAHLNVGKTKITCC